MMAVIWGHNSLCFSGVISCVFACALLMHSSLISAGTLSQGGGYDLQTDVAGTGGTMMRCDIWTLDGTVAQADAIRQHGAGGIQLEGGFWRTTQSVSTNDRIFVSGFDP